MLRDIEAKKPDGSPAYVPTTLWSRRSHLKAYFQTLDPPLDISTVDSNIYVALVALQRKHVPSHTREFKVSDLFEFWARAPNEGEWLLYKAISLFGFYGLARNSELVGLTWNEVHVDDDGVWILLHRVKCPEDGAYSKILIPRIKGHRVVPADIFLAYRDSVLAAHLSCTRLWVQWRNKKWYNQPLGKNALRKVPQLVANFLFPGQNNEGYRGHSWRPSGATALANNGGTVLQLQTAGHWQSVKVATLYVHESEAARKQIAETMCGQSSQEEPPVSTTTAPQPEPGTIAPPCKLPKIVFNAPLTNCTINIFTTH